MKDQHQSISRDQPLPAEWKVEQGLNAYLAESGFDKLAYESKWTPAAIGPIKFSVPNTPRHRRAIMLHDLHHVATGYGTDGVGEGQISMWEIRGGLCGLGLYVSWIVLSAGFLGFFSSPRQMLIAWKSAGGKNLFCPDNHEYDELLAMSIGELRKLLGINETGHFAGRRGLGSLAPKKGKSSVED